MVLMLKFQTIKWLSDRVMGRLLKFSSINHACLIL